MLEKMNRFYPVWLNLLPLIVLFFSILYLGVSYDQLPDRIATHYNFMGIPDDYGRKERVIALPIIGIVVTVAMLLINAFAIMRPDDPRKVFNLDPAQLEALSLSELETMRVLMARCMYVVYFLVALMISYGIVGGVRVDLGLQPGTGIWMAVLAGALLCVSIYMVVKAISWTFAPAKK